jgi:hypothetical protein
MILIGGFRDRIGGDYDSYVCWYNKGTRDHNLEFGFVAIMNLFRLLKLNTSYLFFFFSFFTYLCVYLGIKKHTIYTNIALLFYILIPSLYLTSFTLIRQSFSIAISFYAFHYLLERKYLYYFIFMFIGISIHYSCIIPLLVFLLVFKWGNLIKIRNLYVFMCLSFIIGQIGIIQWLSIFFKNSHYLYYVSSKYSNAVPLLKLLAMNAMGCLVIYYYSKFGFRNSNQKYFLLLYVCSILFLNVFSESTELTRIYIYFRFFEILLVAEIIYNTSGKKRFYLVVFLSFFYLFPFFRAVKIDYEKAPEILKMTPYKSLLIN